VQEIEQILERARLAWVQSVRTTGKPKAPSWIMNDSGLRQYFDALEGTDVDKYDSDEDAASDLATNTDIWHAREDFLREDLTRCGWLDQRTEKEINYGGFPPATTYLYWWANDPRKIVEEFKAKLRNLLSEAMALNRNQG
jgi:hypothetical protein